MVAFFSIEFDLKMIHMKEKADLYRLREVIFKREKKKKKKIVHELPVLLHSKWLLLYYLP